MTDYTDDYEPEEEEEIKSDCRTCKFLKIKKTMNYGECSETGLIILGSQLECRYYKKGKRANG